MECPQTIPLLKRLYHLPALPLRGRQALHHLADLSDSSGSDSSRGAPDQAVRSVGAKAGGGGWGGVLRVGSALRVYASPLYNYLFLLDDAGDGCKGKTCLLLNGPVGLPFSTKSDDQRLLFVGCLGSSTQVSPVFSSVLD